MKPCNVYELIKGGLFGQRFRMRVGGIFGHSGLTIMSDLGSVNDQSNARLGLLLFVFYLLIYAAFMGLNAFYPQVMRSTPFGGVNLAVLYGFGLIIGAVLLALIYMVICKSEPEPRSEGK